MTKVSIIVPTHNEDLRYINMMLDSLSATEEASYELIVIDNGSHKEGVKNLLYKRFLAGDICKLYLSPDNCFFAAANNIGVNLSSPESSHVLLLNTDIQIKNPLWLKEMLGVHEPGVTACQIHAPNTKLERVDGWCFLVDRHVYIEQNGLDEDFPFYGSITILQRQILNAGFRVAGIKKYNSFIRHFGGKGGHCPKEHKPHISELSHFFNDKKITTIPQLNFETEL